MMYEEPIQVETLVKELSSIQQVFTQYAGMRPFGVSLIIGGLEKGKPRLFETEPSGAMAEYKAIAIGKNKKHAMRVLEQGFKDNMSFDKAFLLGAKAIEAGKKDEKFDIEKLDVAYITDDKGFSKIEPGEIKSVLEKGKKTK